MTKEVLEFLPDELRDISSTLYDDENFVKLDMIADSVLASLLFRNEPTARAGSSQQEITSDHLISDLCQPHPDPRQCILIGPAGHGKTTLLKQMTLKINRHASANPGSCPCIAVYCHVNNFIATFPAYKHTLSLPCIQQLAAESLGVDGEWYEALDRLLKSGTPLVNTAVVSTDHRTCSGASD